MACPPVKIGILGNPSEFNSDFSDIMEAIRNEELNHLVVLPEVSDDPNVIEHFREFSLKNDLTIVRSCGISDPEKCLNYNLDKRNKNGKATFHFLGEGALCSDELREIYPDPCSCINILFLDSSCLAKLSADEDDLVKFDLIVDASHGYDLLTKDKHLSLGTSSIFDNSTYTASDLLYYNSSEVSYAVLCIESCYCIKIQFKRSDGSTIYTAYVR